MIQKFKIVLATIFFLFTIAAMIQKFKIVWAATFFLFIIAAGSYFVGFAFAEENSFSKILLLDKGGRR